MATLTIARALSRAGAGVALRPRVGAGLLRLQAGQQFSTFQRNKPHLNIGTIGHVDHGWVDGWIELALLLYVLLGMKLTLSLFPL
jgi:hypothetical protein